jgi:Domain of unknown function (DUF4878)
MKPVRQAVTIALLSLLSLSACGVLSSGPGATVRTFYELVEDGEATRASELVSAALRTQMGDKLRTGLLSQTEKIRESGGIKSMEVRDEKVTGELATLTVIVTYGNGQVDTDEVKLVREDGQWRITGNK